MNEIGKFDVEKTIELIFVNDDASVERLLEGTTEFERVEFLREFPECLEMLACSAYLA
ncbi:MAG: hypothetical protein LUH21_12890 [Clostridiales bacterium]|nr:hypothetical protein [Clostridiales bacterium]